VQPKGKQQNFAGPQNDFFGVDKRFETARSSSALISVLWLFHKPGIALPVTAEMFASATCQLQLDKANAATLSHQKKKRLGRCPAGKSTYIRLYWYSDKLAHAAMFFR
jgi:hypothetical protein